MISTVFDEDGAYVEDIHRRANKVKSLELWECVSEMMD
jgi:hypothetical protein